MISFNKNQIIAFIVASLVVAGIIFFVYTIFFSGSVVVTVAPIGEDVMVQKILPKGTKLDFVSVRNFVAKTQRFPYPQVNPAAIGSNLNNIISGQGSR